MPRITLSWSPDYEENKELDDVRLFQPNVDYSVEIPADTEVTYEAVCYHVDNWLRGCGFSISDKDYYQ